MLTLRQFELQVNDKILHRGREYYENGAVADLSETGKGLWHAKVVGKETYTIEIELFRKNSIKSYSCNCPYDGDTCKHVVAVLFLLKEELAKPLISKKEAPKSSFEKLLQSISLEEYRHFILTYAAKDKKFKSLFTHHFVSKDKNIDMQKVYTQLLKSVIRSSSHGGFVDYQSARRLANEVNKLLDDSLEFVQKGNFRNAFIVAKSILTEVIELLTYCDDSGGYIGDILNHAIEQIRMIAGTESITMDLQELIFDFVQSALKLPVYFDYGDFGYEMADVYQSLAIKLNKEKDYLDFIDRQIRTAPSWEYSFRKDHFIERKIVFLKAIGKINEAQMLLDKNMDIVDVRQGEVSRLIEEKNWPVARKLITEGIEIAGKKGHPGTVAKWEKELLRIAVLENDKSVIRRYTKHFAFDRGFHPDYYHQWKNTFTTAAWRKEIDEYIEERIAHITLQYQENKGSAWYSPDILLLDLLAPVYIEEKYWDRLLALMSRVTDLDRLLTYHDHLLKIYPLQLLTIYLPAFEEKAREAGDVNRYADLAIQMEMVIKTIPDGKEKIIALAEDIIRKYPRRTAMIRELNAVIKMGRGAGR